MMKKLLIFPLLFSGVLCASEIYIKLGTTTSPAQVKEIRSLVKQMGYSHHMREDEERFMLYSGPFANKNAALQALQKLKRTFPSAVAVKLREEQTPPTQSQPAQASHNKENHSKSSENAFFVGASLGFHNTAADVSGSITNINMPSESGLGYGLELGYTLSQTLWFTLGYEILSTGDITLDNIYASANYNFYTQEDYTLYAGVLLGNSELSWDSAPLANAASTSGPSSIFFGIQAGAEYPLSVENLSLFGSYSLINVDLSTSLSANGESANVDHSMVHNLKVGVRYSF
ncbi:MAG: outer membrane beta-barrel protein [Sulfurimonas sp.]|jgi:hypothetical protein|nr:outer membrane beta-barrel protein [Sulfurimonas sp.]